MIIDQPNTKTNITIICNKHGEFKQTPINHLMGSSCPKCSRGNYSLIAIKWLDLLSEQNNIFIQHAENEGEYTIPITAFRVDGFCKEITTAYEFYGDAFHGNPKIFNSNDNCHPFNKNVTAEQLYENTIEREQKIKSLGFNLITIWECDFKI